MNARIDFLMYSFVLYKPKWIEILESDGIMLSREFLQVIYTLLHFLDKRIEIFSFSLYLLIWGNH